MPAARSSSARPSAVNSRMPCGSSVMPTPSSRISGARSKTRHAMPRRCRFNASVSPQMPPPTMRISSMARSVAGGGDAERALLEIALRGRQLAHDKHGNAGDEHRQRANEKDRRGVPAGRQHEATEHRPDDGADAANAEGPTDAGRADRRRIEGRGKRVRADLRTDDAEAGGEHCRDEQGNRA